MSDLFAHRGKDQWHAFSRDNPCPVCGKPDNCKITNDGNAIYCGRVASNHGQNAGGQFLHFLHDGIDYGRPGLTDAYRKPAKRLNSSTPKQVEIVSTSNFERLAKQAAKCGADELSTLATELGVDEHALRKLGVGVLSVYGPTKWTFPERDANWKVIGISCRSKSDGKKRSMKGSTRGLYYADDWFNTPGPIYLVEGGSDTAALMTMGLCAVGRPSNCGGADHLAELLKPHSDREIIVVGERDKKDSGKWPGREGAISTATQLAERLGRPVSWALPPDPFKDARIYLNASDPKPPWKLELETIAPPPPPEPYQSPVGQERSLDDWREDLVKGRLGSIKHPGLYFDGSPTGAGKSYADRKAMMAVDGSITLVPAHENGDELVEELKEAGFDAEKLPARASPEAAEDYEANKKPGQTPWNYGVCLDMENANSATECGLQVGSAVCSNCEYNKNCDFLIKREMAVAAQHTIATHHMFAKSGSDLSKNRDLMLVHENVLNLLRPSIHTNPEFLAWVGMVAAEASCAEREKAPKLVDSRDIETFELMQDTVEALLKLCEETSTTCTYIPTQTTALSRHVQQKLFRACKALKDRLENLPCRDKGEAMQIVLNLISGQLYCCAIQVTPKYKSTNENEVSKSIVGVWHTELPSGIPIIFSDATGSTDIIERLSGRTCKDITPVGRMTAKRPPLQIPIDITKATKPLSVARVLGSIMLLRPDARRIGVIGHQHHISDLLREEGPLGHLEGRITKWSYFGKGDDRASNEWHQECDLLVILGTPRVSTEAVETELIRAGDFQAAGEVPEWGTRRWEAMTPCGALRVVSGKGYLNEKWRLASQVLVKSALLQAVGRSRSLQHDGVEAIVFSNEPLGLMVEDENTTMKPLSELGLKWAAWFEGEIANPFNNIKRFCNFSNVEMGEITGLTKDRVSKLLKELADFGYLTKLEHGKWAVSSLIESDRRFA